MPTEPRSQCLHPLPLESAPTSVCTPYLQVAAEHWVELPASYSTFPPAVYFTDGSVYVSTLLSLALSSSSVTVTHGPSPVLRACLNSSWWREKKLSFSGVTHRPRASGRDLSLQEISPLRKRARRGLIQGEVVSGHSLSLTLLVFFFFFLPSCFQFPLQLP